MEQLQAKIRCWVAALAIVYVSLRSAGLGPTPISREVAMLVSAYCFFYIGFGAFILVHIQNHPGHYYWRRLLPMFGDYTSLAFIMIYGGQASAAFFALIVWVTQGNGMRYGSNYLLIAALLSQLALLAVYLLSPHWHAQPEIMIAFSLTALLAPIYAWSVLRQTAQARDAAVTAMQAKSRFLAQASHDLRQPIHAIGYQIDALRHTRLSSSQMTLVDRIERSLGGVAGLFKSLLDISKLDSGSIEPRPETFVLNPFFEELVLQNEQAAFWNKVDLRLVPTSVSVRADPTLLATMVQNLLSNAIKYGRGGKVLVGVRRKGNAVSIEVHDQGIGIEAHDLPNIFDEFYRAHVAGDHDAEGVGLGLSIVRRLAELSNFSVSIDSVRGKGTSVRLSNIYVSADHVMRSVALIEEAPMPLAGMRIILIDDEIDILDATAQLLIRWGCEVQASVAIPERPIEADLIVADFDLGGGVTGLAAIDDLRRQLGESIPAILISGHAEDRIRKNADLANIYLLAKPVPPAILRSSLSAIRLHLRDEA